MEIEDFAIIAFCATIIISVFALEVDARAQEFRREDLQPPNSPILPVVKPAAPPPPPSTVNETTPLLDNTPRTRSQRMAEHYRSLVETHYLWRPYGRVPREIPNEFTEYAPEPFVHYGAPDFLSRFRSPSPSRSLDRAERGVSNARTHRDDPHLYYGTI